MVEAVCAGLLLPLLACVCYMSIALDCGRDLRSCFVVICGKDVRNPARVYFSRVCRAV